MSDRAAAAQTAEEESMQQQEATRQSQPERSRRDDMREFFELRRQFDAEIARVFGDARK